MRKLCPSRWAQRVSHCPRFSSRTKVPRRRAEAPMSRPEQRARVRNRSGAPSSFQHTPSAENRSVCFESGNGGIDSHRNDGRRIMRTILCASTGRRTRSSSRFRSKPLPDSAESSRNDGLITIGFRNRHGRKPRPQTRSLVGRVRHSSRGGQGSNAKDEPSGQPSEHAAFPSAVVSSLDGRCLPVPDALALRNGNEKRP